MPLFINLTEINLTEKKLIFGGINEVLIDRQDDWVKEFICSYKGIIKCLTVNRKSPS